MTPDKVMQPMQMCHLWSWNQLNLIILVCLCQRFKIFVLLSRHSLSHFLLNQNWKWERHFNNFCSRLTALIGWHTQMRRISIIMAMNNSWFFGKPSLIGILLKLLIYRQTPAPTANHTLPNSVDILALNFITFFETVWCWELKKVQNCLNRSFRL